jgi:hypothetical protein
MNDESALVGISLREMRFVLSAHEPSLAGASLGGLARDRRGIPKYGNLHRQSGFAEESNFHE